MNEIIGLFIIHGVFGGWLKIKWKKEGEIYEICSNWWVRWKRVWGIYWKSEKKWNGTFRRRNTGNKEWY